MISFAREAPRPHWLKSPGLQGMPESDRSGTQNLLKIALRNERPMVPKVVPTGPPAELERHPKVSKIVSKSPFKSDAGKNYVLECLLLRLCHKTQLKTQTQKLELGKRRRIS